VKRVGWLVELTITDKSFGIAVQECNERRRLVVVVVVAVVKIVKIDKSCKRKEEILRGGGSATETKKR
jgi:hypothetical protein